MRKSKPVDLHAHKVLDENILDRETLKSILVDALIDGDIEILKDVLIKFIA